MKKNLFFARLLGLAAFICSAGATYGQSAPVVNTDEYVYRSHGTVYVSETEKIEGDLRYDFAGNDKLILIQKGKDRKFTAKDILGFKLDTLGGMILESVNSDGLGGGKSFYWNITPGNGTKMKLYKTFVTENTLAGAKIEGGKIQGNWENVVLLPGKDKVVSVGNLAITPYAKKLVPYLKDCPELAKKVTDKAEGYTSAKAFSMSSAMGAATGKPDETLESIKRIVQEYNACGEAVGKQ